jgi:hypothetical protein
MAHRRQRGSSVKLQFIERESRTVQQSAGATTSWYYDIETKAGVYDARCITRDGRDCSLDDAYWVLVKIDGTCVGGWLPGHHCNMAEKDFGQPMVHTIQVYAAGVRELLTQNAPMWQIVESEVAA